MNISNNKCIRRLSFRSLKTNRQQVFMTILAIILTTTLFSALFSIFLGIKDSMDDFRFRAYGSSADAAISYIDDNAEKVLASSKAITEIGYTKNVAFYSDENLFNIPAQMMYSDETASKFFFQIPTEGSSPSEEDEIVLDTYMADLLGFEKKVGSTSEITFQLKTEEPTFITKTFRLSGFYTASGNTPEHIIGISEKYADELIDAYDIKGYKCAGMNFSFLSPMSDFTSLESELKHSGSGSFISFNEAKTSDLSENIELVVSVVILALIIFVTGFLIINNIFRIKLASEVRYYGLLKTIGVTSRQLKRMIRTETAILCIVGVPLGLLLGYIAGRLVLPKIMIITTIEAATFTNRYLPAIFIFSALFSIITVFISNSASVAKTAKVSPVEALRYNEAASLKKAPRTKSHGASSIAKRSLEVNKLKTALVILSLSLAIALFTGVSFLGNGINENSDFFVQDIDFVIGTRDYFLGNPDGAPLTKSQIDMFKKDLGGDLTGCVSELDSPFLDIKSKKNIPDAAAQIIGIDPELLPMTGLDDDTLDKLKDGDPYPALIEATDVLPYKIGDIIELETVTAHFYDEKTGNELDANTITDLNGIRIETEGEPIRLKIAAEIDSVPSSLDTKYSFLNSARFVVRSDVLSNLSDGKCHIVSYNIDTNDNDELQRIEKRLDELTDGNTSALRYMSKATEVSSFTKLSDAIKTTGYFLCIIVGVIAVLNFVNAIMTEAVSRKREFALLRAVGMTNSQLRGMLIRECSFYTVAAFILAIPLEIAVMMLLKTAELPWLDLSPVTLVIPFLILLPIFAALSVIVPSVIYDRSKSKSIMDEFRGLY